MSFNLLYDPNVYLIQIVLIIKNLLNLGDFSFHVIQLHLSSIIIIFRLNLYQTLFISKYQRFREF